MIASYNDKILRVNGKPTEIFDYPKNGLLARWALDNSTNDSYSNKHLIVQYAPVFTTGKVNLGTSINRTGPGRTENQEICNALSSGGNFSISFWAKSNIPEGIPSFILGHNGQLNIVPASYNWFTDVSNGAFGIYFWDSYATDCKFTAQPKNDGNWHHIVVGCDNTTIFLYCDNVYEGTKAYVNDSSISRLYIGSSGDVNFPSNVHTIDQIYVYNKKLTATEVAQLWNNGNGI